ncbi:hypothetical protein OG792_12810 [Micromonospora sp. NBC_01699]|uniref:hypothetical protein n=1 Tax=Micromonospora sp. NBC_01699 TaxID=2975984 RepID=UPI002E367567|nr:hypothetical protein [Micromonospora sp. NBC_01699]
MSVAPTLAPTVDPAAAYPEFARLATALRDLDWDGVRAVVDGQEPAARTRLIRLAGELSEGGVLPRPRLTAEPGDTLAAALLAGRRIKTAWDIRTGARAADVSRDQFDRFHAILRTAEQLLIDAAAYDPSDPAVWVQRLVTARGLGLGQSEARRRYDRLSEYDPHHLPGQSQLLQQIAPKWGGSLETMHAFARTQMLAAPEGAPNALLVLEAHLEHWLDLPGADQGRYFTDGRVREEIREAAARSVLHPAYRRTVGWVTVENYFAFMFGMIDDEVAAARHFTAVGHLVSESPWEYLGNPLTVFTRRRDRALRRGSAR